jgi:hypothetical protein
MKYDNLMNVKKVKLTELKNTYDYGTVESIKKPKSNLILKIAGAAAIIIAVASTRPEIPASIKQDEIIQKDKRPNASEYMTLEIDNSPDINIGADVLIDPNAPIYSNIYDATNEITPLERGNYDAIIDIDSGNVVETITGLALKHDNYNGLVYISRDAFFDSRYSPIRDFASLDLKEQNKLREEYKTKIDYWINFAYEDCLDKGFVVTAIGTSTGFTNINDVHLYKEGRIK